MDVLKYRRWTKKRKLFLQENCNSLTINQLADKLKISKERIKYELARIGKKSRPTKLRNIIKSELKEVGLRPITYDFIRELKQAGKSYEANKLLKAHLEDVKKAGIDEKKNIVRIDRMKLKTMGVCSKLGCGREAMKERALCQKCTSQKYTSYKKRHNKKC